MGGKIAADQPNSCYTPTLFAIAKLEFYGSDDFAEMACRPVSTAFVRRFLRHEPLPLKR